MNENEILKNWMHVGKSKKEYEIKDKNGEKRILSGEKGIGRFALARLGDSGIIKTKKKLNNGVIWITDWETSYIEQDNFNKVEGTKIQINKLRDKWTKKIIYDLVNYLGILYNDDKMKIVLIFQNQELVVKKRFLNPKIGVNFSSFIKLEYNNKNQELKCEVLSDEFQEKAKQYCGNFDIYKHSSKINIYNKFQNEIFNNEIENLKESLIKVGNFSADLYFGLEKVPLEDTKKFLYKRTNLLEKYKEGIILYRNSFGISSYEGKKDWLELGKRARKSPAAATHPTGAWRVRENQISGKVTIDKIKNGCLRDLSNRQGIEENEYYELFVRIIQKGLEDFEYYRQSIIREIIKKNVDIQEKNNILVDKIVKKPNIIKNFSDDEIKKLSTELKDLKNKDVEYKKNKDLTEKRYKYDVRILNVLATIGLRASSVAHEMKNDRNYIDQNYEYIVKALKKYKFWDFLLEEEQRKYSYCNIPELLNKNKEINKKILNFMDIMLENIEKKEFYSENYNIYELMLEIKERWEQNYSWLNIQINTQNRNSLNKIFKDVVKVIFDNLILNTTQQNEDINTIEIDIGFELENKMIRFFYKDNGRGLNEDYKKNPYRILEVHETSRKNGHGLGMWIVNNTIKMTGGEIEKILSNKGFEIIFTIGEDNV